MTDTTPNLDPSVRLAIDEHLDAIDDALRGVAALRKERQSVLDDVQTQIEEMLAARTGGEPTLEDVRALLAEMDSPESYAAVRGAPPFETAPGKTGAGEERLQRARPAIPAKAIVAAFLSPFALVFHGAAIVLLVHLLVPGARIPNLTVSYTAPLAYPLFFASALSPLLVVFLGCLAASQIRRSKAGKLGELRLHGMWLAMFDSLGLPVLLTIAYSAWLGRIVWELNMPGLESASLEVYAGTALSLAGFWCVVSLLVLLGQIVGAISTRPSQTWIASGKLALWVAFGGGVGAFVVFAAMSDLHREPEGTALWLVLLFAAEAFAFVLGWKARTRLMGKIAMTLSVCAMALGVSLVP